MNPLIGVVDYGRGNLRSVCKALEAVGAGVRLLETPAEMASCHAIVLPGVGAFGDCAQNLQERGFFLPLRSWVRENRPFLGICLGYQILFESSEENPGFEGLSAFAGRVCRFPSGQGLKIPHIGWNSLHFPRQSPLFHGLQEGTFVYFVHSFYPVPADSQLVSSVCNYGVLFAASVSSGNVHAVQFHPEKSQEAGLQILGNFVRIAGGGNC